MLLEQLRARLLAERVSRTDAVATALLSTLLGDVETLGKKPGTPVITDRDVQMTALQFYNNAMEAHKSLSTATVRDEQRIADIGHEINILMAYLPTMASPESIKQVVTEVGTNLGLVMKTLTATYGKGCFDAQLARQYIDELIKK